MGKTVQAISNISETTFKEQSFNVPDLNPFEVYIKVKACGVCHTDLYKLVGKTDVVAGHETVGEVIEAGSLVKHLKVGDIVGFGYLKSSCLDCEQCSSGNEILCAERVRFPEGLGGFAHQAVFDARFCYKIPENIEAKHAGPLMCAGATVFSALYNYNVSPTHRIGVVGIGGLGHLALQFARAWGCHVVAISTNSKKEEEARSFGAHEFWNSSEFSDEQLEKLDKLDFILNTVSGDLDWDQYFSLLKPNGTFILVGVTEKPMTFNAGIFLGYQLKFAGSLVASRNVSNLMLKFAARHNIKPQIEEYPMTAEGTTQAVQRVRDNKTRYRAVLIAPE
ncbi:hypothetical protein BC943DRAFT_313933 [Umbelopsis sp. AD052]|nr:hypothetical protein BC943DRAFT_313933 [Umbelopsis sp. AD052]